MPIGASKNRAGQVTEEKLVTAARRLLMTRGWGNFNQIDLAYEADVSRPTTSRYVSSLRTLTLYAFAEECSAMKEACEQAETPDEFIGALTTHSWRKTSSIAIALHPMTQDPWRSETPDASARMLRFEDLARQLGKLIERAHTGGEVSEVVANSLARAQLYAVLSAIAAEDRDAIAVINFM